MGLGVDLPRRGDVYLISLDPTRGSEIRKTRPCVVVSPDELNDHLGTFLAAPMTTGGHPYPFRIPCRFQDTVGHVVLDQLWAIDHTRTIRRLGSLTTDTMDEVLNVLQRMFAA